VEIATLSLAVLAFMGLSLEDKGSELSAAVHVFEIQLIAHILVVDKWPADHMTIFSPLALMG
jgi:hypothetical protein